MAETRIALQRFSFVGELLYSAGYAGWIILTDEGELLAKLWMLARARAYVNLCSLINAPGFSCPDHTLAFGAITDDLFFELLENRDELGKIKQQLTGKYEDLGGAATEVLRFLQSSSVRIPVYPANETILTAVHEKLVTLYSSVYGNEATGSHNGSPRLFERSRSMRQYVREWITSWDMQRLYPGHMPRIGFSEERVDLSEGEEYADGTA